MSQLVFVSGLVVAMAYFPRTSAPASWPRSIIKTIPLPLFAVAAYLGGAGVFLVAGLFLSALGDFVLSRDGDGPFLYGLSAFALAHVLYILHFLTLSEAPFYEAFVSTPIAAIALVALMVSTELWLAPFTGALRWPVRIYVIIIGAMGLTALALPRGWSLLGAMLFIISDLILAIELFRMSETNRHRKLAGYAIWSFYIAGQALILWGGLTT